MRLKLLSILVLVVGLGVTGVLAQQGATVNPLPGSVWTYLGPTFGADWVAIPAAGSSPQIANYIYAGPASGANNVPTFRPMVSNDILPSPVLRGDPQAPTPAVGDNDTSIATTAFVRSQINTSTACPSITNYGGVGDGTTDNTAAFNNAKAVTKCIAFPAGKFRFNSALTYAFTADLQSLTIIGMGADLSVLYFPNAVGTALAITKNQLAQSVHIRDLTFTTSTADADIAISSTQTRAATATQIQGGYATSDITNVTFRADEGYWETGYGSPSSITNGWHTGLLLKDSIWDIVGMSMYGPTPTGTGGWSGTNGGTAIDVETVNTFILPVIFNVSRGNFTWLYKGLVTGAHSQGFQITQSNFVGCYYGIHVPPSSTSVTQLAVTASQFNNIYNIKLDFPMAVLIISNNLMYMPDNGVAIDFTTPSLMTTITGNAFNGGSTIGNTAIRLNPNSSDIVAPVITGNTFYSMATGISAGANALGLVISSNVFKAVTNNIVSTAAGDNSITGGTANTKPAQQSISGVANNGSGLVRLTVASTAGWWNGQMALVGGTTGTNPGISGGQNIATPVKVIDATHFDLLNVQFGGAYTSGGYLTTYP